jgi:alpha-glucosidase
LSGLPVNKSLSIDYSFDDKVFYGAYENQYLFCDNLLIIPVESYKEITKIYLPEGSWYHLFTGERFEGNQELFWECPLEYLPIFVKAGSILLLQAPINHVEEKHDGQLNVHIYKSHGTTAQLLYEDDGKTTAYLNGDFSKIMFRMNFDENLLEIEKFEGEYQSEFTTANIFFHSYTIHKAEVDHKKLKIDHKSIAFLDEISAFNPVPEDNHKFKICKKVPCISIPMDGKNKVSVVLNRK